MAREHLTKSAAAERLGVTPKAIERFVAAGLPCEGVGAKRRFPWPEIRNWRDTELRRQERANVERRGDASSFDKARSEKMQADARLAEPTLAERSGSLIPLEVHTQRLGDICDRLSAVCRGGLSRFVGEIQRAQTVQEAQALADTIGDEMLKSFRGVADDTEAADVVAAEARSA